MSCQVFSNAHLTNYHCQKNCFSAPCRGVEKACDVFLTNNPLFCVFNCFYGMDSNSKRNSFIFLNCKRNNFEASVHLQVYHARRAVKTSHFSPCRPAGMPRWRTTARHFSDQSASVTAVCRRPESSSRRPGAVLPRSLPSHSHSGTVSLASCHGL